MKRRRILSLLLAALMLIPCTSCAGSDPEERETEPVSAVEQPVQPAEETDVETELSDKLPERDFGGADYTILTAAEQWQNTYAAEELNGDVLNDAIFARNSAVETRFGVKLNMEIVNGYSAGTSTVQSKLRGTVQAGDAVYDLLAASSAYTAPYIMDGVLGELSQSEWLDLEAPWYYRATNDALTVKGKLYQTAGAFGVQTLATCGCIAFNKELLTAMGEEYPYAAALGGKWTYDDMLALAEKACSDLNGNGEPDKGDRYGILSTQNESLQWLAFGMGYRIALKDDEGTPAFVGATERNVNALDRLSALMKRSDLYFAANIDPAAEAIPMFTAGQGLFLMYELKIMTYDAMRDGPDFGILPYPKYDEEQEAYISKCFPDVAAIPVVVKDADMSGIVLEALNSETFRSVVPVYYNILLQRKLSRDDDSAAMIDLAREGTLCDFGMAYFQSLSADLFSLEAILSSGSLTTWFASNEKALNKKMDKLLTQLAELGGEG